MAMVWQGAGAFDGVGLETPNGRVRTSAREKKGTTITRSSDLLGCPGVLHPDDFESPRTVREGHIMKTDAILFKPSGSVLDTDRPAPFAPRRSARRNFLKSAAVALLALTLGIIPAAFAD